MSHLLTVLFDHTWYAVWGLSCARLCAVEAVDFEAFLLKHGASHFAVNFVFIGLIPMVVYYVFGAVLAAVDFGVGHGWIHSRRLQTNAPLPTLAQYIDALWMGTINWIVVGLPFTAFLNIHVMPWRQALDLPVLPVPLQLAVCVLTVEILFYAAHRVMHFPYLYSRVHKLHHTYTAPFGIAAIYAHPLEHLLSNVIPVSAGPVLAGMSPPWACAWATLATVNTMISHSGWQLPGAHSPSWHDWHHERYNENYGVIGLCDWIAGSCTQYADASAKGVYDLPRKKVCRK